MNKAYCYIPQAIDKKLSEGISTNPHAVGWTPAFIASLRGAYDSAHGFAVEGTANTNPMWSLDIDTEDYNGDSTQADNFWNIVEQLTSFRNEQKKKQAEAIKNFNENKTEIWSTISEYYPDLNVFYSRAAQLSYYFIKAIDNYIAQQKQQGNLITRQQVINGIPLTDESNTIVTDESGKPIMAVNSDKIFSAVFNQFMADYSIKMNEVHGQEAYDHYQNEFEKLFNPKVWAALLIVSKAQLKHMEGLKVSLTDNSASDIDISTLNDNDFADLFDPENSTREGWQIMTDCMSAYGNLSAEVRKALSNIYVMTHEKDGSRSILRDDLGYPVRMNSVTSYQDLMDLLRNCRSKSRMMKLISNNSKFQGLNNALKTYTLKNTKEKVQIIDFGIVSNNGRNSGDWVSYIDSKGVEHIKENLNMQLDFVAAPNEVLQTQLYNNFRKVFQPYVQIQFEAMKIKFYILNRTRAEQSIKTYLFGVKYNPIKGSIADTSRFHWRASDIERLKTVLNAFVDKTDSQGKIVDSIWKKSAATQRLALFEAFNALGIQCSDKALDTLLGNRKSLSEVIKNLSNLAQYSGIKDLKADTKDNFNSWLTKEGVNGEKERQAKIETIITKLEESGNGIVYENKCRTVNGKGQSVTYYGDVQPNFMGDLLGKIQSFSEVSTPAEKEAARKEFREWLYKKYLSSSQFCTKFDKDKNPQASGIKNFWLRTLWEEANAKEGEGSMFDEGSFTSQFQFMRIVTGKYEERIIPFENFTTKQHFQQVISSYFALDTQSNQKMSDFVYVPVFVLGDSGVCKVLKVKRKSTFQDYTRDNNNKFDESSIIEELYGIYESELRRMQLFKDFTNQELKRLLSLEGKDFNNLSAKEIEEAKKRYLEKRLLNPNIEANANKFTMLTFLNKEFEGRDFTKLGVKEIKESIGKYLEAGFKNFLKVGEDVGILGNTAEEKRFSDILTIKDPDNKEKKKTVKLNERLKEFYYNTYLSNILQYQVFTGDLGFYDNVKDFQKRYKEVHAPGNVLDVDATWDGVEVVKANAQGIKAQRTVYFRDIRVNTETANQEMMEVLLRVHASDIEAANKAIAEGVTVPKEGQAEIDRQKKLKALLGDKYDIYQKFVKKTSQTDGQGFRHIDSFRNLMIMAGMWNDRKEALYRKIETINSRVISEKRNITPKELEEVSAYYTTIMPLKPYMFTMEKINVTGENGRNDNIFIPVQHKYAEAILIPCLLPVDSQLRQVAEFMGSNKIDLICADTVVKVGMWGQTELEEQNPKGSIDIKDNLSKAKIHELDYSDYRIQSNVPEHINVQRALGTQVRKLIMGNIDMFSSKVYDYLGGASFKITKDGSKVELTGRNLVSLYTSLIVANMMESFAKFKKNIENEKKLSNLLTAAIVNNDRYSLHQLLDIAVNDGKFSTPLYEGTIEHDTTAMIFSIFRKEVNKQDMKGGSAVQVSDWGITTKDEVSGEDRPLKFVTDEENGNVLYAEIEIPFNFSYTDSAGNEVKLKFNDYCNTDGTFKTDEQGNALIEKDFPGILDIIAYRIPSERDYSMLNCKVVRCTEMTAGGTIRVPAQGTTIAGFDFDIDKLYLIRKDFVKRRRALESHYTGSEKNRIFTKVYELDAARQRKIEAEAKASESAERQAQLEEELEKLGHNYNDYAHIEDAFETLFTGLVSDYTPVYEELEEDDKLYLERQCIISGKDLADFMRVWSTDTNTGFAEDAWESIDENKAYKGSEVFHMLFDNFDTSKVSKQGWKLFNKMSYNERVFEDVETAEDNVNYTPQSAIIAKLRRIREASGEYEDVVIKGKVKRVYTNSLAHYWDTMIEQNPYMEEEDAYDKNKLFEQAAKEVGLWKDIEYEEYLVEYDLNKAVSQNSRTARNNLIFELMRHRLMDKETIKDRLTPGGFDNARSAAGYLKELLGVNEEQDAADPSTLLFYNQLNQVAAKLIGIFANQNTNHQLSSIVKKLDLTEPIIFDGMIGAKILKSTESLNGLGQEAISDKIGKSLLLKEVQLSDSTLVDIDLNLAEFLAASVDAVKDPVLNYLNFNTTTASVGALLARMGYATKDIGVLFNQPVIREICDIIQNSGGITTFAAAKSKVLRNYTNNIEEYKNARTNITTNSLANQIVKYRDTNNANSSKKDALAALRADEDFRRTQLSALKIFEQAYNASRELNKFIATTKFTASNAVGSTMGFFYNQQYVVNDYINQKETALKMVIYEALKTGEEATQKSLDTKLPRELINNREEYIKSQVENPFAFEQCMYDLNKELINVLTKYYPYDKAQYKDRRDILNKFLPDSNVLDAETIDNIHRETTQSLLANTDGEFNPTDSYMDADGNYSIVKLTNKEVGEETEYYLTNREYYLYRFPIEAFNLMKQGKLPSVITKYLGFSYSDFKDRSTGLTTKQLHIFVNLSAEQSDKNTFTDAWAQIASDGKSDSEIIRETKVDFVKHYIRTAFTLPMDITLRNLEYAKGERYTALNEKYKQYEQGLRTLLDNIVSKDDVFISEDIINASNVDKVSLPTEEQTKLEAQIQKALAREHERTAISKKIAKGLFFHNYYKTGFGVGPHSFIQFTPLEVKNLLEVGKGNNKVSYLDYISLDNLDKLSMVSTNGRTPRSIIEFGYMYALNHPDNYKLVHRMPAEGNTRYASYFVEGGTRRSSFTVDLSSSSEDAVRANAEFVLSQDKETGNFKVHPVIIRNKAVYIAMIDGEYNFTGNINDPSRHEVTYIEVPILGKKNTSSIYAATLDEAIAAARKGTAVLERIERELNEEDRKAIEENANASTQEETVNLDNLLSEDSEEGTSEEDASEEFGENFNEDVQFNEEDIDALAEKLSKCNKVSEDFLIEYLLSSLDEKVEGELDREEWVPKTKQALTEETNKLLKNMPVKSSIISEATRRQLLINDLVEQLKENIKSGKTKVYTNLTKEEIC